MFNHEILDHSTDTVQSGNFRTKHYRKQFKPVNEIQKVAILKYVIANFDNLYAEDLNGRPSNATVIGKK